MSDVSDVIGVLDDLVKDGEVSWADAVKMFREEFSFGLRDCMEFAKRWQSMQEDRNMKKETK